MRALIPQGVNSIEPRYAKVLAANLSEMLKPAIVWEEMNMRTKRVSRGRRRERVSKESLRSSGRSVPLSSAVGRLAAGALGKS